MLATAVIVVGLALTAVLLPAESAADIFSVAAIGVGMSLGAATVLAARGGVRELIRVDILMLWVLYGLTFLEFLFPQPEVNEIVSDAAARSGAYAVLLGFVGLAIGRHLVPKQVASQTGSPFSQNQLFIFFVFAAVVGYLHILLAVDFDVIEMFRQMSLPRFWQSWTRGRYGDVYSLLYELGLLIYLIPPLGGLMFARKDEYTAVQKLVILVVLMTTFYYGFASGTRNVFATYVIAFGGAYFLAKPHVKLSRLVLIAVPGIALLLAGTALMLEFRTIGGLGSIFSREDYQYNTLFIDNNLVSISQLTQIFPNSVDYLGLEVPFHILIKPIPRAIWPAKPEEMSTSIETALGAQPGTTLSSTFIGEAFMAGGFIAVLLTALLFGAAAALWNRVGQNRHSSFSQVLYASGFLCAAMAMRSMITMVPFMLPTLALWLIGRMWPRTPVNRRRQPLVGDRTYGDR